MMGKAGSPAATINNNPTNNQLSSIIAPRRRNYPAFSPGIITCQYIYSPKKFVRLTVKPNGKILPQNKLNVHSTTIKLRG
jgi:hypothetical protein